jgi:hypothetical protein
LSNGGVFGGGLSSLGEGSCAKAAIHSSWCAAATRGETGPVLPKAGFGAGAIEADEAGDGDGVDPQAGASRNDAAGASGATGLGKTRGAVTGATGPVSTGSRRGFRTSAAAAWIFGVGNKSAVSGDLATMAETSPAAPASPD